MIKIKPAGQSSKIKIRHLYNPVNHILERGEHIIEGEFAYHDSLGADNINPKLSFKLPKVLFPRNESEYKEIIIDLVNRKLFSPINQGYKLFSFQIFNKLDNGINNFYFTASLQYSLDLDIISKYKLKGLMPFLPDQVKVDSITHL